uniref:ALG5 dolichyl-phosphate beta-glucosyltransferase n=1 Tax=Homo sapiens TaxID=9606 RepID=A0A7P0TA95_HUMAN
MAPLLLQLAVLGAALAAAALVLTCMSAFRFPSLHLQLLQKCQHSIDMKKRNSS